MSARRAPTPLLAGALIALSLAAFWPALHLGFINYDDPDYITQNPGIQHGLSLESVRWAFTTGQAGNWHPLTWISLMLDWQIGRGRPFVFHLTNLVLHCVNAALLFILFRRMTKSVWRPFLLAAVFAIHPLRVESVAWAAERKDVLCYCFGLLALIAYVHHAHRPSPVRYAAVVIGFALCLLAKSVLVTLPCLMLLLDFWPLGRHRLGQRLPEGQETPPPSSTGRLVLEKLPLLAMSAATSWMTFHMQSVGDSITEFDRLPLTTRLANAALAYARYAEKLAFPRDMAVFYPYVTDWRPWQIACSAAALILVSVFVFWKARRLPWAFVGWFWFIGLLVPVIGIIQSGLQSIADRWTYLSTCGLAVMLLWSIPAGWAASTVFRRSLEGASAALLIALALLTRMQLRHWSGSAALFRHAIEATDRNWLAYGALGNAYLVEGSYADAAQALRSGIQAKPDFFQGVCNLGNALAAQKRFQEAMEQYRLAAELRPEAPEPHYNMGSILLADPSQAKQAAAEFEKAIERRPSDAAGYIELARAYGKLGQPDKAIQSLLIAVKVDPKHAKAQYRLGLALSEAGRRDEARAAYRAAIAIDPESADFRNALAWSLATSPQATPADGREAVEVLLALPAMKGKEPDPNLLDTLAAAYAREGRHADALSTLNRAIESARARGMTALVAEFRARASLYEQGSPYTQPDIEPAHP